MYRGGSLKDRETNRIPRGIVVTTRLNGQDEQTRIIDGKYRLIFTDSALEFYDTCGAGVVESIPRGILREFEAMESEN